MQGDRVSRFKVASSNLQGSSSSSSSGDISFLLRIQSLLHGLLSELLFLPFLELFELWNICPVRLIRSLVHSPSHLSANLVNNVIS